RGSGVRSRVGSHVEGRKSRRESEIGSRIESCGEGRSVRRGNALLSTLDGLPTTDSRLTRDSQLQTLDYKGTRFMLRITVALWLVLLGVVAAQQTANEPRFTGKTVVMDAKDVSAGRRSFEAGARTYWHSHDKGQLLLVEQGHMRTQKKGGPVRDLGVGESDY